MSVRGPNSALTEFLRSQGINANEITSRWRRRNRAQEEQNFADEAADNEAREAVRAEVAPNALNGEDPEIEAIAVAAARKRRAVDRDEDEEGTALCVSCGSRFTITVYSKEVDDGYLCLSCAKVTRKKKPAASATAKRNRKKLAAALLEGKNKPVPSLQDLCIARVAEYIDSVDELGELTADNFIKISRILCRNRQLDARTAQLFLKEEITSLELWDCSALPTESYNVIAAMCPNLEKLTLGMCGQLTGENLLRFAELTHLKEIYLDGPFLVRKEAWLEFLDIAGPKLTSIAIQNVYRVDIEVLAVMVETCPNLESVSLARLSQLNDSTPFYLLGNLSKLKHLELSELERHAVDDDALKTTLNLVGSQLESLKIRHAPELTDRAVNAIAASCGNLSTLELVGLDKITEQEVVYMFQNWTEREVPALQRLSLERCIQLGNAALAAAVAHSAANLVELNINSLKMVSGAGIVGLAGLPNLTKVDIGFLGGVEPHHIYKMATSPSLKMVQAFGNIRLSGMPLPSQITVVGTM